jgi:hypothetical protein
MPWSMQPQARAILRAIVLDGPESAQFLRYRIEFEC